MAGRVADRVSLFRNRQLPFRVPNSRRGGVQRARIKNGVLFGNQPSLGEGRFYGRVVGLSKGPDGSLYPTRNEGPKTKPFPKGVLIVDSRGRTVGVRLAAEVK
jgi:glucose/arabinose dehydrogenase